MKLEILNRLTQLANPLVRWLLRSPLHSVVSKDIVLLVHFGRKTGRPYPTPVTYVEDGNVLYICTSRAGWWKNLAAKPEVKVVLRGEERAGHATVVADDHGRIVAGIKNLLSHVPRDAPFYDIKMSEGHPDPSDVDRAAAQVVLIEIRLV